jgi:hypothetical protein
MSRMYHERHNKEFCRVVVIRVKTSDKKDDLLALKGIKPAQWIYVALDVLWRVAWVVPSVDLSETWKRWKAVNGMLERPLSSMIVIR